MSVLYTLELTSKFPFPVVCHHVNSLCVSGAICHHKTWSTLLQAEACCQYGVKPLPKPVLSNWPLYVQEQISVKFELNKKFKKMHLKMSAKWRPFQFRPQYVNSWIWVVMYGLSQLKMNKSFIQSVSQLVILGNSAKHYKLVIKHYSFSEKIFHHSSSENDITACSVHEWH